MLKSLQKVAVYPLVPAVLFLVKPPYPVFPERDLYLRYLDLMMQGFLQYFYPLILFGRLRR